MREVKLISCMRYENNLVRKSESKRSLEIPRSTWENGIEKCFRGIGYENVEWIHLA
jgi:hypothetical protein